MRQLLARQRGKKKNLPIAVLISGNGSNLQALIDAEAINNLAATIRLVISSHTSAPGIARARRAGIPVRVVSPSDFPSPDSHDMALERILAEAHVELLCLAGYRRVIGLHVLRAFQNRILNIHPSLLPAFPGLHAPRQALEYGVKITGCSVHIVTDELDMGPVIAQVPVPVWSDDTLASLTARILAEEHRIYPQAVRWFCEGRLRLEGRVVHAETTIDAHDGAE